MIVLKIILYVLLGVLGTAVALILLALWLPVTADVSYVGGKFTYKLGFSFLRLLDSDGKGFMKRRKKSKKKNVRKPEQAEVSEEEDDDEWDIPDNPDEWEIPEDYYDYDVPEYGEPEEPEAPEKSDEDDEDDEDEVRSEKIRRIKEKKSGKTENKPEDDKEKEPSGEKTVGDKIESLLDIWDIGGRPLLRAFRGIHLKNVYIDFIVADEDAYKCALNYGKVCTAVYNGLAWLGEAFTVSYKTVDVRCGFSLKKSQWDASCKVSFRFCNLVIAGGWFFATYVFKILIPKKRKNKKKK